jgi:hypothetical protein
MSTLLPGPPRLRFGFLITAGMTLCVIATFLVLRHILDAELNASILNVASIQAAALTDQPKPGTCTSTSGSSPRRRPRSIQELVRYAQVWSERRGSLLRSRYMVRDLPGPGGAPAAAAGELVWRDRGLRRLPGAIGLLPPGSAGRPARAARPPGGRPPGDPERHAPPGGGVRGGARPSHRGGQGSWEVAGSPPGPSARSPTSSAGGGAWAPEP